MSCQRAGLGTVADKTNAASVTTHALNCHQINYKYQQRYRQRGMRFPAAISAQKSPAKLNCFIIRVPYQSKKYSEQKCGIKMKQLGNDKSYQVLQ